MMSETAPASSPPAARVVPVRRTLVQRVLEWTLLLLVVATVAGLLGDLWWIFDLCNHFRFQYVLLLIAFVVTCSLRRQWAGLTFAFIALLINALMLLPLYTGQVPTGALDAKDATSQQGIRLLAFNVQTKNQQYEEVTRYINESSADLVILQEIDQRWDRAIRSKLTRFRVILSVPRADNFGMAVLERVPTEAQESSHLQIDEVRDMEIAEGLSQVPTIEVLARWRGRPFALLALHTLPPIRAEIAHVRDSQLHGAALWAREQSKAGLPAIIMGDLNATPWCAPFRHLCEDASLINSQVGRGVQGSWHAKLPAFLRIPIDHCLHTRDLITVDRRVGPDAFGSDHLPVLVLIDWAAR